ncbi:hypothetical protein H2198_005942 [Neophaeococcomyces mojaviensis]|uniref:Uncharacterized protein n=1 Tax=Neophaeococcomyces mojaviensis TaxID=3383035 RepID=A0ACC3A4C6_9EURO|nr:hypothetical protein H2198_005942 [Knufia sp. JES_112]
MASSSATHKVKSWIYTTAGYPTTLELKDTTVPAIPASNHVLVKIHASSINPVDIQLMNVPLFSLPGLWHDKHISRDFAGTILAIGPDVKNFQKGDEVCGFINDFSGKSGGLTEVAHLDMVTTCMVKKPKGLSWTQAASLPLVYLTARTSIAKVERSMQVNPASANKLVVLGGSSSTGIYTVKLAKQRGWTVLSSCSHRNVDFVKDLGADEIVDYTTGPHAVVDAVKLFEPSAIVDNVGGTETIGLAGYYVTIVGDKTSRTSMGGSALYLTHPRMVLRYYLGAWGLGPKYECIVLDAKKEYLEEIDNLKPEEVIVDSVFSFNQVKEAFEKLNTGRCRGKVVIEIEK